MEEMKLIGIDLAKSVFQLHGATAAGESVFRKKLSRSQLVPFLARQAPCCVAMEACASAHCWGREIAKLGHEVRLIPPIELWPNLGDASSEGGVSWRVSKPARTSRRSDTP